MEILKESLECHFSIGRRFGVSEYEERQRAEMKQATAACRHGNLPVTAVRAES